MQLKNDLWDFALDFYQQPGVEPACLLLQKEFNLRINRIIYAMWCGSLGEAAGEEAYEVADQWQLEVTRPLRAIRYKVRKKKVQSDELNACYAQLRQAELACEQVELALLYEQPRFRVDAQGSASLALTNLECYLSASGVEFDTELELAVGPILSAINQYL